MKAHNRNELVELQVEELASKMEIAQKVRQDREKQIMQRKEVIYNNTRQDTATEFFKRKIQNVEQKAIEKERSIKDMETLEAQLLERIKMTQNRQRQAFDELEKVMYEQ